MLRLVSCCLAVVPVALGVPVPRPAQTPAAFLRAHESRAPLPMLAAPARARVQKACYGGRVADEDEAPAAASPFGGRWQGSFTERGAGGAERTVSYDLRIDASGRIVGSGMEEDAEGSTGWVGNVFHGDIDEQGRFEGRWDWNGHAQYSERGALRPSGSAHIVGKIEDFDGVPRRSHHLRLEASA